MPKVSLLIFFSCITFIGFAQQKTLNNLLTELKKHPQEDTIRLKLLSDIAYTYYSLNPAEGIKMSDATIQLARKLNNKKGLAVGLLYKGINHSSIQTDSFALQLYNEALLIAKQENSQSLISKIYHNIGMYYFNKSDYAKAITFQNQSLAIAQIIHDSGLIGSCYVSIGVAYQYLSVYAEALNYQLKALSIFNKTNDQLSTADAYTNLGIIYNNLEQFPKALEYDKKAFEIFQKLGLKQKMANVLGNEANTYDNMDDSASALQRYRQALAICEEINYQRGIASHTGNIGILYSYYSEYDKAVLYLTKALYISKTINDKSSQIVFYNRLGSIYTNISNEELANFGISTKKRYAVALNYYQQAYALAKETQSLLRQAWALEGISEIYEMQKDFKKALAYYKQGDVIGDSIFNDKTRNNITRLEMQYEFNRVQDSLKAVNDKQQALAKVELDKQQILNNSLFAGSGFLIIAGFASFLFYKRNHDIRTQKNEAELNAQVVETEIKALRAQMNPHFIFNSLNSINDYIDKHDTEMATVFTTKFAKLMRRILENSEQKEILLSNELQTLELYLQLEAMRLQNGFVYEIKVDTHIDKDNTLIPPLLLQPFLENSIVHGLPKKQGGKITLHIQKVHGMLTCIVEDNGTGIQPNASISEMQLERKSLGTKITQDRINIINKLKRSNGKVELKNLIQGTRAEVTLPFETAF